MIVVVVTWIVPNFNTFSPFTNKKVWKGVFFNFCLFEKKKKKKSLIFMSKF
jgi:hypothetical protein